MQKERLEFKDDFVKSIAKKANRNFLTEDFDNKLMVSIQNKHTYKKEATSRLKKSMFYFVIGILLVAVYTLISIIGKSINSSSVRTLDIVTLFFSIIIAIAFMDNYKRLFKSMSF